MNKKNNGVFMDNTSINEADKFSPKLRIDRNTNLKIDELNLLCNSYINQWNISDKHNELMFCKIFGIQLKKIRLIKGLTQTKLAKKINVTFQQIQKYEKGTNMVNPVKELKMCEVLHVNRNYFIMPLIDNNLHFTKRGINGDIK
jgi:DNA-binding XRE family transcriptional regulator